MYTIKAAIHHNFNRFIRNEIFPNTIGPIGIQESNISTTDLISIFESQITSRHLDLQARELKEKSQSFYTIGSSGHEGNAAFGFVFPYTDMAFIHYRSGAFFIQRSKQLDDQNTISNVLLSLVASKKDPISGGRHKVFGSKKLNIPPQTSTIASHLPKALGTALSIPRAKELKLTGQLPNDSIIIASFGDASYNHASCQSTLNAAEWITFNNYPLPLLFICEDNGLGISSPTPEKWIKSSMTGRTCIKYIQTNGLNILETLNKTQEAYDYIKKKHKPVFLHFKCVRLLGHAGSDIETQYLSTKKIEQTEQNDPLLYTAKIILENKILSKEEILHLYESVANNILSKVPSVILEPKLSSVEEIKSSLFSEEKPSLKKASLTKDERSQFYGTQKNKRAQVRNMSQSINLALFDLMLDYKNIVLLGEDIGKKGGVYHITADLQNAFGQRRVFDTILDETTILGTAIGLSHNNFLPIPEIQFLAYLHNAEDQIRGEASTLSFFSSGQFSNPMVLRLPSLGYQKGFGGHFHNDNSLAVLRDIPSIIIVCPSNGHDAALLLRTCVQLAWSKGCVVAFIEPIALYMTKDLHEKHDQKWLSIYPHHEKQIAFGDIAVSGEESKITVVSYANGYYLSLKAQKILKEKYNIKIKVIDLRWLKPLPMENLCKELIPSEHIIIVDECRKTGSLSEELMCRLHETTEVQAKISRVTGHDSFIPLGDAATVVLPSLEDIIKKAQEAASLL